MYRVLKDVIRKARTDLLQLKREKRNIGLVALEVKNRMKVAQEKPNLGKAVNLANKVILID